MVSFVPVIDSTIASSAEGCVGRSTRQAHILQLNEIQLNVKGATVKLLAFPQAPAGTLIVACEDCPIQYGAGAGVVLSLLSRSCIGYRN